MKKTELLSPAGNMETLLAAIHNGADAVYIGGKFFGARAFAPNFDNEDLKKAVYYAHLYNVKLYVTANTVIFEDEIEEFLEYMKFLYEINVDAVIMQDIGMISLVRKLIPNLEIHASTQINAHNDETLKLLKSIGVKRVVLAREMTINEIKNLKADIELEIFIHGALCVSYSGNCLFSSLNGGRSGNRGKCVGSCRLPYTLLQNNKEIKNEYLLSTKELCQVNNIKEILDCNIESLKIEGRMKSPEYVGYVTKIYRKLIDQYYQNQDPKITEEELINLTKLFNRKFTDGYLFEDNIYNTKSPNHLGYPLGQIIKLTNKKIYIKLSDNLYQEDGIRFVNNHKGMILNKLYNEKGLLVNHIKKGNIAVIDNKIDIKTKDDVSKTIDTKLIKEISNYQKKKIPISFIVKAKLGKPLTVTIKDNTNTITKTSVSLEKAINKPTTKEEIIQKLNKLGNTPFTIENIDIDLDQVFIPIKYLNDLRRNLCDELIKQKTKSKNKIEFHYQKKEINAKEKNSINILVRNENQLKTALKYADKIYTEDFELYKKYKNKNVYYKLPRIIQNYKHFENENLLVSELGSVYKYSKNNNVITDYPLNVTNSETVKFLKSLNVKTVTLSVEIKDYDLIKKYAKDTEIIIYGKLDLMILKDFHFKGDNLSLKDRFGNVFPIINGKYTTILHCNNLVKNNIKGNSRIILFNENEKQIKTLINQD